MKTVLWLGVFWRLLSVAQAEPVLPTEFISAPDDPLCHAARDRISGCFVIPGEMRWSSEAPNFRIFPTGETQSVGVPRDGELVRMPKAFLEAWFASPASPDGVVTGEFSVCPLAEPNPHVVAQVCVERASKLVFLPKVEPK